tara:strand:- start:338 stop:568 length:231 start_codon:yes stop_codon:yes gene_type:complete
MKTRKNKNKTEANLISFKLLLNSKNQIISELSYIPEKDIDKVFTKEEAILLGALVQRAKSKLDTLHDFLQREAQAI